MARVQLQMPYAKYHGKAAIPGQPGGQVNYSVGNANYARTLVNPDQPDSLHQSTIRSMLAGVAAAYAALTQAQAANWRAAADGITRTNPVGGEYEFTGMSLYAQVNMLRVMNGQGTTVTVPSLTTVAPPTVVDNPTVNGANLEIDITHSTGITVNYWWIQVTAALNSPNRLARPSDYRTLTTSFADSFVTVGASVQTVSIPMEYFTVAAADSIGIRVVPISSGYVPGTEFVNKNVLVS